MYDSVVGIYRANQGDKSHKDYFRAFKVMTDEIDRILPLIIGINEARAQREQFML